MNRQNAWLAGVGLWVWLVLLAPSDLTAEPHLSVRTGLRCSQCHVNRTGGGARNSFGSMYAQTRLPMWRKAYQGRMLNSFLALGGNLRVRATGTPSDSLQRTSLAVTEASLQLEARVVQDVLTFYLDQSVGPGGASTREAFGLIESLPLEGYIKAGKFFLPFGMRLIDDDAFIRQRTGFSYRTSDIGLELGIEPGPLSLFAALTNGTQGAGETNSSKQFTTSAALIFRHWRVGGSASFNRGSTGRRDVAGGFAGITFGRFTVLGEADWIFDTPDEGEFLDQFAAYVEGNFLVTPGLNLKTTYGFLDPNVDIGENARVRWRFGAEWFPIPFLQVSGFYTLLEDIPQATTDLDRLSLELHAFF